MKMTIRHCRDFRVIGSGRAATWDRTSWMDLTRVGEGTSRYRTRAKALYSDTGIYFLFDCEDRRLNCTRTLDYDDLYLEDVVEVFLWPDESRSVYFEYELSPLGMELPILVSNHGGRFFGWQPWHYEGDRLIRRATTVQKGRKRPMAGTTGWSAELFIPFALLHGVLPAPVKPGTEWRVNLYRIDYDQSPETHWAWSPDTGPDFHNLKGFGTLVFGR